MTFRQTHAVLATAALLALGAGHSASATSYFPASDEAAASQDARARRAPLPAHIAAAALGARREQIVFGRTRPNQRAAVFDGAFIPATYASNRQATHVNVGRQISEMVLEVGIMAPGAGQLNISTSYGAQGMFSTVGGVSPYTMTLPGFNIGSNISVSGGRGPGPSTSVPEPATALLLLAGAAGLLASRRR